MNWFTVGFDEAEKMGQTRRSGPQRNFWTKPGETAVVRFLSPAKDTVNIKRAFIPEAKGPKYFTSPMVEPDPFVQAGYNLQSTFIWKILDRRIIEFTDRSGEDQKIGPRILYFAVGQRDRKALQAFEAQMLADYNENLVEDGKSPVGPEEYNITSYDMKLTKPQKGAWQFFAVRGGKPKELSAEDTTLVTEGDFSIEEEIKPLPLNEIQQMLGQLKTTAPTASGEEYSYDPAEAAEEPTFFGGGK